MKKVNKLETRLLLPESRIVDVEDKNINVTDKNSSIIHDLAVGYECKSWNDAELLAILSGIKPTQAVEILKQYRLHEVEDYLDSFVPKVTEHQKKVVMTAFEF